MIKRLFRTFELTKNEQRVVLMAVLVLLTVVFIGYECRVHSAHVRALAASEAKTSPTPAQIDDER